MSFLLLALAFPAPTRAAGGPVASAALSAWGPGLRGLLLWSATPEGSLETASESWLKTLSPLSLDRPEADNAPLAPLAERLEAASVEMPDLRARLEGLVSLPIVERRRLLKDLRGLRLSVGADQAYLRAFIEDYHREARRDRPDLFKLKMKRASESAAAFNRGFPQLFYKRLRESEEAPDLAQTVRVLIAGDLHPDNTEIEPWRGTRVLQPNDFDDAGPAPAAVEIARAFTGAALLEGKGRGRREALVREAFRAYRESSGLAFRGWADRAAGEKSVRKAKPLDRDWPNRAGKPVQDKVLAGRLLKAAGIQGDGWKVFDRSGAGLSSIGLRRYMFTHPGKRHVYEMKELRAPAYLFFTGGKPPTSHRPRVEAANRRLRKARTEFRTFRMGGLEWVVRRREGEFTPLVLTSENSSARVLAGMTAQLHRVSAPPLGLREALDAVREGLVLDSADFMARMHRALRRILKSGVWD